MNQANLLKRLIDYVRLEIETGAIKRCSPVGIAYRDYAENARRPRAIDLVDFYHGWHAAITHFLETGLILGQDPEDLHNQYLDFSADEFYRSYLLPGGWLRKVLWKIRWFKKEWWIDLPKCQEYLVICLTTQKWQIGIDLVGDPTLSLLCLSVRLSNVPF